MASVLAQGLSLAQGGSGGKPNLALDTTHLLLKIAANHRLSELGTATWGRVLRSASGDGASSKKYFGSTDRPVSKSILE